MSIYCNDFSFCVFSYLFVHIIIVYRVSFCSDCSECVNGNCIYENLENSALTIDSNKTPKSTCHCNENWSGRNCDIFSCSGRLRLVEISGRIIDATGNYTTDNKCTWLIGNGDKNQPIRLRVREYATECGWDNLYIYDGTSIAAPLIAVLSGIMPPEDINYFPELTLTSGYGYLHLYSDAAYNMTGFVIDYWQSQCPNNCSYNGDCLFDGSCLCSKGWTGLGCEEALCPKNCSNNGQCNDTGCHCFSGYRGEDCSVAENLGYWEKIKVNDGILPEPSASQSSILIGDDFYIIGGYHFRSNKHVQIYKFNLKLKSWKKVVADGTPTARYAHSINHFENEILMLGGVSHADILNDFYSFSLEKSLWKKIQSTDDSFLLATSGHTSHIIDNVLYVFFGHNPVYGFLNYVQTFDLKKRTWSIFKTSGATIKGTYGHTSLYDSQANCVLVHGGYTSDSVAAYYLSNSLYALNLESKSWKVLASSGYNQYLHSADIINRFIFVFGGNTHNDTMMSQGAKCYSNNFLIYDIECNEWHVLDSTLPHFAASRYGHSSFVYADNLYIYGGYNGVLHNDLLKYSIGLCKGSDMSDCLSPLHGMRCRFADNLMCMHLNETAEKLQYKNIQDFKEYKCSARNSNSCDKNILKTCTACTVNSESCVWCGDSCRSNSTGCSKFATSEDACLKDFEGKSSNCVHLHNCHACNLDENCLWNARESKCDFVNKNEVSNRTCDQPACNWHQSCENCTRNSCMWCANMKRCIESNSYVASFPYGLCMEWKTNNEYCPATRCEDHHSCLSCLYNPACGFCDDGSDTGIGQCMIGDYKWVSDLRCQQQHWIFATCPLCQCNGHSRCFENTSTCLACNDNTEGERCDSCKAGYWGNPAVGGSCKPCQCSGDDTCNQNSGQCICGTRGAIGPYCQECDKEHTHLLNENGTGACYYQLTINNILTFNLSREREQNLTKINFYNIPPAKDKDVEFNVTCTYLANNSFLANVSVVLRQGNQHQVVLPNSICHLFLYRFSSKEHVFGDNCNTSFFVYIFNIHAPIVIQIYFSQTDNLDLLKFFITFFSCFFSLLLIAFIAWKVKQRYDLYRRSQRHMQEMAEMARRPFSTCYVIVDGGDDDDEINSDLKQSLKKEKSTDCDSALIPMLCVHG